MTINQSTCKIKYFYILFCNFYKYKNLSMIIGTMPISRDFEILKKKFILYDQIDVEETQEMLYIYEIKMKLLIKQ